MDSASWDGTFNFGGLSLDLKADFPDITKSVFSKSLSKIQPDLTQFRGD
jgi:hypothetical protein